MKKYIPAIALFPLQLHAAAPELESLFNLSLEELSRIDVVEVASGTPQSVSSASSTVSVVHKSQWQAMGATTLAQVLTTLPGFNVSLSQLTLNSDVYEVRGLQSGFNVPVQLLLDGQAIKNLSNGGTQFGFHKPLSGISRIEVIRGPGSAIYGADAMAGVINLVTEPYFKDTRLGVRAGSWDTYHAWVETGAEFKDVKLSFSGEFQHHNDDPGRRVSQDLQSVFDDILGSDASQAPGRVNSEDKIADMLVKLSYQDWQLQFWHWQNQDAGLGAGAASALDNLGSFDSENTQVTLSWGTREWLAGELEFDITYQEHHLDARYYLFPAGALLPLDAQGNLSLLQAQALVSFPQGMRGNPGNSGYLSRTQVTHNLTLGEHAVRWQLGYEDQWMTSHETKNFGPGVWDGSLVVSGELTDVTGTEYNYNENMGRNLSWLSLQDEWRLADNWTLTLGARVDSYSDFGSNVTPRGSLVWQARDNLTLRLMAGRAFRAPTHSELGFKNNPVALGNPDLTPETLNNVELSLVWNRLAGLPLNLELTGFKYKAKDLIRYVYAPEYRGNRAQNIAEQSAWGGEVALRFRPSDTLQLDVNYSYVGAQDEFGRAVADIVRSQAYLGANWSALNDWNVNFNAKWLGSRDRLFPDEESPLGSQLLLGGKISYTGFGLSTELALLVENLLDRKAYDPGATGFQGDYPLPGRRILLELNYRF